MQTKIICPRQTVIEEWIDYNGHLNLAFYSLMFDRAVDYVFDTLGIGESYVAKGGSVFAMEVQINYLQELSLGDGVTIAFQLLDYDQKRLHFFEEMYHAGEEYLTATCEQISTNIDMNTRKSAPFDDDALEKIDALMTSHRDLPRASQIGHTIGIIKRK